MERGVGKGRTRDHFLPAGKLLQMLDYIDVIGLDRRAIAEYAGLDLIKLQARTADEDVPAIYYSKLYLASVREMQEHNPALPWAAGMGTDAYRMLWYCIIHCKTLGEALSCAEEFQQTFYRLIGHRVWLSHQGNQAVLEYRFETEMGLPFYAPPQWNQSADFESIVHLSGLRNWYAMIGWLIGRLLETDVVQVAAPDVHGLYDASVELPFEKSVQFEAETTAMLFSREQLEYRIVQTPGSLEHLLGHALYWYWMEDRPSVSTAMAIKSLIAGAIDVELPNFEDIAARLHMTSSTLRRRLMDENTSYQQIKNECREASAIEYLHKNELKIHEIGERLGFSETSSFVRSFRKWTGMTPKAYRDAAQAMASD